MRIGQRSYIPGIGYIRIDDVQQIELENLTDGDALPDGFETAEALRQEINTIYQDKLEAGYKAFRIKFSILNDAAKLPTKS